MATEEAVDTIDEQLDQEISNLQQHIDSLKKQLNVQATNILSAESTRQLLATVDPATDDAKLLARRDAQDAHDQLILYRIGAGITSFKVRDPDPNAVDDGRVLGLRFEVMAKTRFFRPYYVFLNRPYPDSPFLRVHRTTVPPCIPCSGLAARYLPKPKEPLSGVEPTESDQRQQDLARFARELRREIVRYHNRMGAIGEMRTAAGLADESYEAGEDGLYRLTAADAQAKHVELGWADGRTGRLVMDDDGKIDRMVVYRDEVRDHQTQREVLGDSKHVKDVIGQMLASRREEADESADG